MSTSRSSTDDFLAIPKAFESLLEFYRRTLESPQLIRESFKVPVGPTPRETIWTLNKTKLYRYQPPSTLDPSQRKKVPLLLVYALINKPYIFDLRPGASFIDFMLHQGFDVYLLDWGAPGPEDQSTRFDDYATKYLPRAVRRLLRVSGAEEFSLLGYCIGATLTVLYAALYPQAPLRNLILLTAPLDFTHHKSSIFTTWLDARFFNVDQMVDLLGNIPPEMIEVGAKLLRPVDNFVGAYTSLYWDFMDEPEAIANWQAMHKWIHDGVPFAGEAFRQWIKDYIQGNKLINNEHVVEGKPVDLANIQVALLNVVAKYDHLVPMSQSVSIMDRVSSSDKELKVVPAGHVGLMGGRNAKHKLWPQLADWLGDRSG